MYLSSKPFTFFVSLLHFPALAILMLVQLSRLEQGPRHLVEHASRPSMTSSISSPVCPWGLLSSGHQAPECREGSPGFSSGLVLFSKLSWVSARQKFISMQEAKPTTACFALSLIIIVFCISCISVSLFSCLVSLEYYYSSGHTLWFRFSMLSQNTCCLCLMLLMLTGSSRLTLTAAPTQL